MSIFSAVAKLFAGLVTAFNAWQENRKAKRLIKLGQLQQEADNRDKVDEIKAGMDAVPPPTSDEVDDDLSKGKF